MKRLLIGLAGFALSTFVLFPLFADGAEAGIKYDVSVNTPNISVRVGNYPYRHHRVHGVQPRPVRIDGYLRGDVKIAVRLSRYAGVRQKRLLGLRRRGYRWMEIGRMYNIPPRVVRAAMSHQTWNIFLKGNIGAGKRGRGNIRSVAHRHGR